MITPVLMPQLGLEVTEGTIVEILVEVGAIVAKDEAVMVLATDKADADIVASTAGIVRSLEVELGDTVAVGTTLLLLADTVDEPLRAALPPSPTPADATIATSAVDATRVSPYKSTTQADQLPRLRVSPVARRAAADQGVPLETITGSGPRGRITLEDVRQAIARSPILAPPAPRAAATVPGGTTVEELSPMRRAIARRMSRSQSEIPQYHLVRELDATHLMAQKEAAAAAAEGGARPGINDLLIQAIAEMLVRHPDLAASFVEGEDGDNAALHRPDAVHVGLAVTTDRGLVVPVIRHAHERSLREIATDRTRLVSDAREGTLGLAQMAGGTVSLSNLGGFGIDRFAAMVNPGESAIVAVGRIADRLIPRGRGIAVVPMLTVTVTFDHRVVDGATGARALSDLAELLEGAMPWRI